MQYFCLHRREAGAKGGLPAVGMKLNMLVQRLQVIIDPFYMYLKLYRISKIMLQKLESFKFPLIMKIIQNLDRFVLLGLHLANGALQAVIRQTRDLQCTL